MKVISLLAALSFTTLAYCDDAAALRAEMQRGMDAHCAAILKGDFKAAERSMDAFFAPDCKIVSDGKAMTYPAWKAQIFGSLKMMKKVNEMTLKCSNLKLSGNKAVATTTLHLRGTLPDMGGGSKTHRFEEDAVSISTFMKRGGKWMCVSDVDKSTSMKMDGKPIKF